MKKNAKFDSGKPMKQAIDMMRQSVPDPREHSNKCLPIAILAHGVVQKLLDPDDSAKRKGMP